MNRNLLTHETIMKLLLSTHKTSFALGSGGTGNSQCIRHLEAATNVFHLPIYLP